MPIENDILIYGILMLAAYVFTGRIMAFKRVDPATACVTDLTLWSSFRQRAVCWKSVPSIHR